MKRAFVYTFGCKVNQYESQQIIERLALNGYAISDEIERSDLAIVNSCTVTSQADRQLRSLVSQLKRKNPKAKIIVTGCYAKRSKDELKGILPGVDIVDDKKEILKSGEKDPSITGFFNHSRAFVKIQDGCDAYCSYCIVPYIRPKLYSKPIEQVVEEIKNLVSNGYPEIVLTGIHIGKYSYGLENLLEQIVSLPGNFRVRLSSIEVNEVDDKLLEAMAKNKDKICPHLHIPLQSASTNMLKKMNRHYSPKEFSEKLKNIYRLLPDAGVSTDVIVGFPGETDKDFKETENFLKENAFSRLHVFRYSPRPGTPAADFEGKVSPETAKERAKALGKMDKVLQDNFWRKFLGKTRTCVLEGSKNTLLTDNYIRLSQEGGPQNCAKGKVSEYLLYEISGSPFGKPA